MYRKQLQELEAILQYYMLKKLDSINPEVTFCMIRDYSTIPITLQYLLRVFIWFLFWNLVLDLLITLGFSWWSEILEMDSIAVRIHFLFLILEIKLKKNLMKGYMKQSHLRVLFDNLMKAL